MLSRSPLNDKTYGELLAEAVAQISLYSKEWTNFNVSDPGITTLENLTAFTFVQRSNIATISDQVRREMLRLLGCTCQKNIPQRLLVQPPKGFAGWLPAHQQFQVGDMAYETTEPICCNEWQVIGLVSEQGGVSRDLSHLALQWDGAFYPFGKEPQVGDALTLHLDGAPHSGTPIHLWVEEVEGDVRTPFTSEQGALFGQVSWQYYSTEGWHDVQVLEDQTHGLLATGGITLSIETPLPAPLSQDGHYALRCVLADGVYDLPPKLRRIAVNLLPIEKRSQRACTFTYDWQEGQRDIFIHSDLAAKTLLYVYVKEKEGYRLYQQGSTEHPQEGRYYQMEVMAEGVQISFDVEHFGYAPQWGEEAVKVVCYDEEMIHRRWLGQVYGFTNQFIPLDDGTQVVEEDFALLACCPDGRGGEIYHFVPPQGTDEDKLCYTLDIAQGGIAITNPGMGSTYSLYLANCAVSGGATLPAKQVKLSTLYQGQRYQFEGIGVVCGGTRGENLEELRERFTKDMKAVKVAALPSDYLYLAKHVPGLCIHKVGLEADGERNLVKLVVKPYSNQRHPTLSEDYLEQISIHLERHRMLTTRITLQQPRYVPVDIVVTLYGDPLVPNLEASVQAKLETLVDGIQGDIPFGATLSFHSISQAIQQMPGVRMVQDLRLLAGLGAKSSGPDLKLDFDCLPYLAHAHVKVVAVEAAHRR